MNENKVLLNIESDLGEDFRTLLYEPFLEQYPKKRTKYEYRHAIILIMNYFKQLRGQRYSFELLDEDDAKKYFAHISEQVENEYVSADYFRKNLSICNSFGDYLVTRIPQVCDNDLWTGGVSYHNPFAHIIFPRDEYRVSTQNVVTIEQIDDAIAKAKDFDARLYIMMLLSFRMMIPYGSILKLKKENIQFITDNAYQGIVGAITYIQSGKQCFARIPKDITKQVKGVWETRPDGAPLFTNQRGNALSGKNLTDLMQKFSSATGCHITLGQMRTRALIDLVSRNPEEIDAIGDYTGLSKRALLGYGEAFDRINDTCIAEKASFKMIEIVD